MMMTAISFHGIDYGLDDAVGHSHTDNGQGIPQTAVEDQVAHIPNPFEIEWKHVSPPYDEAGAAAASSIASDA